MDRPCSIQIADLAIIATVFAALILLHLVFKRKHRTKRKRTMHYTEGTIDAIDFGPTTICFSLLPSAEFLHALDGGEKMVLFVEDSDGMMMVDSAKDETSLPVRTVGVLSSRNAQLVKPVKTKSGKEVLWFQLRAGLSFCPRNFLLEAKNNRNIVRVRVCDPNHVEKVEGAAPFCQAIRGLSLRIG